MLLHQVAMNMPCTSPNSQLVPSKKSLTRNDSDEEVGVKKFAGPAPMTEMTISDYTITTLHYTLTVSPDHIVIFGAAVIHKFLH